MEHLGVAERAAMSQNVDQDIYWAYATQVMTGSFITCAVIHHVLSPWLFNRYNSAYRELNMNRRMEWDSRIVSTLHATLVSVLCVISLIDERYMWDDPFNATGYVGVTALAISVGYFLCDLISMPIYYRGLNLIIFTIHHGVAMFAFVMVLYSRMCMIYSIYRLTTEMSTPFTNQRWFYRTLGYTPDRRRVAMVTLIFSILFAITRNFLVLPYWFLIFNVYNCPAHLEAKERLPYLDFIWLIGSIVLDALNTYWALSVYPIGYKAAMMLYTADWRTDIDLARIRIKGRFQSARRRAMNTELLISLRRTTSFGRLQKVLHDRLHLPEDLSFFSEALSEPEFDEHNSPAVARPHKFHRFRHRSNSLDQHNQKVDMVKLERKEIPSDKGVLNSSIHDGLNYRGHRRVKQKSHN